MRRYLSASAALALLLTTSGRAPQAKKTEPDRLRFSPGQAWSLEDSLLTRITDPSTGSALTPSVKGIFRYKVEKTLADGSTVVAVNIVSLRGGPSMKSLAQLPVDHPVRAEQSILVTPDGQLYGPYPPSDKLNLVAAPGASDWLLARPGAPWISYKLPGTALDVGASVSRKIQNETWDISRAGDESIAGVDCAVYVAKLQDDAMKVVETTWFDRGSGSVVKRELSEKRAKGVWSVLLQVRL